jgi:aminocarboxymuconate-semialdehyde decarboxylase
MMAKDRMPRHWLPWLVGMPAETCLAICSMIFGGVFERLPKLRTCFAHGGGGFPGTLGRIDHGWHARPDLCAVHCPKPPREYLRHIYVDSLVHDEHALRSLIRMFGCDRIALGTDYPFPLGETEPGKLIRMLTELEKRDREQLLGGTAIDFLGLKREMFA